MKAEKESRHIEQGFKVEEKNQFKKDEMLFEKNGQVTRLLTICQGIR